MIYDICIVGSGAGGAPIAYELANAGYKVVVLEKGKYYKESDIDKDEIAVSRRDKFTPPLWEEQHVINERDATGKITRYLGSESGWSFWNGSLVGGSSNLMSGYFHRMKPKDFKLFSTYGKIKGANVVDWVIDYEELEPYYEKVERVVGVSGKLTTYKSLEPRSTQQFPYPKLAETPITKDFDKACDALGIEYFPTPRAILSTPDNGRNSCAYSNFCGSYACATGAKGSARASLLQRCDAKIIPEAFVYKLESNASRVTKAHYYDQEKQTHTIEAKIFVLSAQAIESSRLLLNSKNSYFPKGLANSSGEVGKNLIFSAGGVGEGRLDVKELEAGLFFNRSLSEYEFEVEGKKYKGGTTDFLFEHANIITRAIKEFYDDEGNILWGDALAKKMQKSITTSRVLTFEVFNDWLPTDYCNVTIDSEVKDKYGVNVAAINLYSHPHDIMVGKHLAKQGKKILQEMGAREISVGISSAPPPNLVAGGCRFGDDPKSSVLDRDCKAHDLENLYVSDASFMPTGGSVPYTWTIYANSFRVADAIKRRLIS